ncbi:MAG: alkylmercury lyase family protein [Candidatus Eremiobacteraeota bacterium]|nr:alkylmercury lyase family protein [Candidatus Eremiobacteraeota bacterium]
MLIFRSEEHVRRWCGQWKLNLGAVLSLQKVRALAALWYGSDRRDPTWRRKTQQETVDAFQSLGLIAPFWKI